MAQPTLTAAPFLFAGRHAVDNTPRLHPIPLGVAKINTTPHWKLREHARAYREPDGPLYTGRELLARLYATPAHLRPGQTEPST